MPSAHLYFIMLCLVMVLGFGDAPVFFDPDTAWHLAAGNTIRLYHKIPFADSWSFTATDEVWYNLSWLFDTALSFLFTWGGFSALYALTILTFAGCMTLMAAHCLKREASFPILAVLLLPLVLVVFGGTLARPNMCSLLMTVLFYIALHHFNASRKISILIPLPFMMALWVNLHGGFLMAFPLIGCFLMQSWCEKDRQAPKAYLILIALCLAATLLNPYGIGVYYGAYKTLAAPFNKMLTEWKPVAIGHNLQMTILLLAILCLIDTSDKKIPLSDRLLTIMVTLLSLASLRHSIMAALLLMPALSLRLTHIAHNSRWKDRLLKIEQSIAADMRKKDIRIMAATLLATACVAIYLPYPRDAVLSEPAGFPQKNYPLEEAAYVAQHYPTLRFLNDYNIGGYLDYLWHGKIKVFIDGRANSLYSDDVLDDYRVFTESFGFGGKAQMVAEKYKLDGIIIANSSENAGLWKWNPNWKPVFTGKAATVYIKNIP